MVMRERLHQNKGGGEGYNAANVLFCLYSSILLICYFEIRANVERLIKFSSKSFKFKMNIILLRIPLFVCVGDMGQRLASLQILLTEKTVFFRSCISFLLPNIFIS